MRLKVRSLRRVVKGNLRIEFVSQHLASYGGLELLTRYFRTMNVMSRLRTALATAPSDYGSARLALLVLGLFYVGARRLEHLRYLGGDPLLARFCGLARIPSARTMSNWLKHFPPSCAPVRRCVDGHRNPPESEPTDLPGLRELRLTKQADGV
jgi:hypothetical protein